MQKERIQTEVAATLDVMKEAPPAEFGYLVGKLAALLWVQHEGDMLWIAAHEAACRGWREMRQGDKVTG